MSEDVSPKNDPFDLERVQALMELMEKHGLTEINLRRGDEQWRLRRGPQEMLKMVPAGYPHMNPYAGQSFPSGGQSAPAQQSSQPPAEAKKPEASNLPVIKSPTVGTFYSSPTPEDPPFVSIGSRVQHDTVVCLVEAMKVFNQIPAEVSGTITEILVQNGDSVEFGQPLFRVNPA